MQRVCFVLRLRPEKIEDYRKAHNPVWPEMLKALRDAGWHNYSLFLAPDNSLIGYVETDDWEDSWIRMQQAPINAEWQRYMADCFVESQGGPPDRGIQPLPEVFHLD